jgi:hypothetical protein
MDRLMLSGSIKNQIFNKIIGLGYTAGRISSKPSPWQHTSMGSIS